ncbi:3-oxoacyl-ACP synthase III family protein [Streptomyces sp. ODS05-4]|uniref:3-oxoacyl-ACP synthase III family protein n=1 Tax=Streptomyces sp. ODS05-4 TaxID=2944939 RepID=UPI00210C8904|nr:ketoacyl-ACP synthase III [Streptomyces sp. ODS05-4]
MTVHTPAAGGLGILGTGSYLPERVVPNEAFGPLAGVSAEWIERKTGIRQRHYAADHEAASDLAVEAAVRALDSAGAEAADLAWIIVATSTPDHPQPATAAFVQHRLGAHGAAAFDVNAVCAGFLAALHTGVALAGAPGLDGRPRLALVIGTEVYSRILDLGDRRTAPLFGDGAGAAVVGPVRADRGLIGTGLRTDGRLHELIGVTAGGSRVPASEKTVARGDHFFRMRGRDVREYVERELPAAVAGALDAFGVRAEEVDHFVPHQANGAMLREVVGSLGLPAARCHLPVELHGNTGSASVPLALDAAHRAGELADGDVVLLAGFGGGMTMGTCLLRWGA